MAKKSLQDVLRARREAAKLVSVRELQEREAARAREAESEEAVALVARWRSEGRLVDGRGKLAAGVYRAVHAAEPRAYFASMRWSRVTKAQLAAAPRCEVARCGSAEDLRAHLVAPRSAGAEEAGADVMTLCAACARRAEKRARDRGRPLARDELAALDPHAPLYDRADIEVLKAKLARPLPEPESR